MGTTETSPSPRLRRGTGIALNSIGFSEVCVFGCEGGVFGGEDRVVSGNGLKLRLYEPSLTRVVHVPRGCQRTHVLPPYPRDTTRGASLRNRVRLLDRAPSGRSSWQPVTVR